MVHMNETEKKQHKSQYDKTRYKNPEIRNEKIAVAIRWQSNPKNIEARRKISRDSARRKRLLNPEKYNAIHRIYNKNRRIKIVRLLGGKCICCGESHIEFLSAQHKNNDGANHRREIGSGSTYNWILKNIEEAKKIIELMCMNCNTSNGFFGYCPHKVSTELIK